MAKPGGPHPCPPPPSFFALLSESKRVTTAFSLPLLAFSYILLLPQSLPIAILSTSSLISDDDDNGVSPLLNINLHWDDSVTPGVAFGSLAASAFIPVFSLLASCSITHAAASILCRGTADVSSSVKSISTSFLRFLFTILCTKAILAGIVILCAILQLVSYHFAAQLLGDPPQNAVDPTSLYVIAACAVVAILLALIFLHLKVEWSLVSPTVVVESTWGIWPLQRSSHLLRGAKKLALLSMLFFGCLENATTWTNSRIARAVSENFEDEWKDLLLVVLTLLTSSLLASLTLVALVGRTVLYAKCKAMHGEGALELDTNHGKDEYIRLAGVDEDDHHGCKMFNLEV